MAADIVITFTGALMPLTRLRHVNNAWPALVKRRLACAVIGCRRVFSIPNGMQ